jgi:Pectate lyase superfamily protein
MSEQSNLRRRITVFGSLVFSMTVALVAFGETSAPPSVSVASVPMPNLGRPCYSVLAFGADPTGTNDSTPAFQSAIQSATSQNGVGVCAPAGTYQISHLTLFSSTATGGTQGGTSLFGAGPDLTVLVATGNGNVFDSCPGYANVTTPSTIPSLCPATLPNYPGPTPNPNSLLRGVVLSNFSIVHTAIPTGAPSSDFFFPYIQGLLVDNVCVNLSHNVFDFGEHTATASYGSITIRNSTCNYSYSGHFMALHGNGTGISVFDNTIVGNNTGIVLDTSDLTGLNVYGSLSAMNWNGNVIEQPFIGMFDFAGGPGSSAAVTAINSGLWKGNTYLGCILVCYYFGLDSVTGGYPPTVAGFNLADVVANSRYDAAYLDGGSVVGGAVMGMQFGGPSSYQGSSGGTASSLLMLRGTPSPGDQIWIIWNPSSSSAYYSAHTVGSMDTPNSIASALAHAAGASPIAQQVDLANPGYGLIGVSVTATPPAGSYTAQPYRVVINSSQLTAIGIPQVGTTCTAPPLASVPGHFPCWAGAFDVGDGIAIRNSVRDVAAVGARVTSQAGAAIHVWPSGADQLNFLNNVLGSDQGVNSFTGLQFENGASNPADYYVTGNDFVGAMQPIVNAMPTPAFVGTGSAVATRVNRGALSYTVGPATQTSAFSISNAGPFDCTYYLKWTIVGSVASTLTLPGIGPAPLASAPPWQVTLPVGAVFSASSRSGSFSVTDTGFCQP